ncbi:hypothetical protein AMATHDRAFT_5532 [Amanita thiersii Skay4041]|uniref:Uncharacterized protein n=1 Tax=Amanita thiersii Skay4041 TaxID=703135 RepID=A0A2A9NLY6_9AGAR|nr:hypothetical protein AMATHDRAFT_5532 [Amanita thiersii Skay4041]
MFSAAGSMTMSTTPGSRSNQTTQKYYSDGFSFRVFRAPVISSYPYTATAKVDPAYRPAHTDMRPKYDWQPTYHDSINGRTQTADDRARAPRYFSDSHREPDNRRASTPYSVYVESPEDFIYERPRSPKSDLYSVSDFDTSSISTPLSTFSPTISDCSTLPSPEQSIVELERSEYSDPSTPIEEIDSQVDTKRSASQLYSTYNQRDRADLGYHSVVPTTTRTPPTRSGSTDEYRFNNDTRRLPGTGYSRTGNQPPPMIHPGPIAVPPPYAESVVSSESDDEVHILARINAQYNAAASSFVPNRRNSISGRDYPNPTSVLPSVSRLSSGQTPESDVHRLYSEQPLTNSPVEIQFSNAATYPSSRGRESPPGRYSPEQITINTDSLPISTPYRSTTSTGLPPQIYPTGDFIPPLAELELESHAKGRPAAPSRGNVEMRHSPPNERHSPPSRSRRSPETADRVLDGIHDRPSPPPVNTGRRYPDYECPPRYPENQKSSPLHFSQDGRSSRATDQVQTNGYSSRGLREQSSSWSVLAEPSTPAHLPATAMFPPNVQYSDEYDGVDRTRNPSHRQSRDRHHSSSKDPTRAGDSERTRGARANVKTGSPTLPVSETLQQVAPVVRNPSPVEGGKPVQTSRSSHKVYENGDISDREPIYRNTHVNNDRAHKVQSGSPKERAGSLRQDQAVHSVPIQSVAPIQAAGEKYPEYDRKRKESVTKRHAPVNAAENLGPIKSTSPPPPPIAVSPTLVPVARQAPQPTNPKLQTLSDQSRSHSRSATPAVPDSQGPYQRPHRRHSDGDRTLAGASSGNYNANQRSASSSPPAVPAASLSAYPSRAPTAPGEPHRRYSDSDVPEPQPPSFQIMPTNTRRSQRDASATPRRLTPVTRTVRWNDNLICPSPILASQRRKGWFNRRGDQLWTNDGQYKPAPAGQEYPPDLDDYPEYGYGWMNEEGVRIDMGHRLIPKVPLRSALKQTQA